MHILFLTQAWDAATRVERAALARVDAARAVAEALCAVDGTRLAAGYDDGAIRVWDAASGACVAGLDGHDDAVAGLAVAGAALVSCDGETLRVWDLDTYAPRGGPVAAPGAEALAASRGRVFSAGPDDPALAAWRPR